MLDVSFLKSAAPQLFLADRIILVHGFKREQISESDFDRLLGQTFEPSVLSRMVVLHPKTPRWGTVHSKAVLTFCGKSGCRVLVHTANDISGDWLSLCQGSWHRDFPRNPSACCEFEASLVQFLTEMGAASGKEGKVMQNVVIPEVKCHDFSSAGCALIASVPGKFSGSSKDSYGLWRMRAILEKQKTIDETGPAAVVMQFSSLGSLKKSYLEDDVMSALFASNSRGSGEVKSSDKLELIIPTMQEVLLSNEGPVSGNSIPIRGQNVHRDHVHSRLHKWSAVGCGRGRTMPHIKTIVRYRVQDPRCIEWMYVGSANLSGAAWGWPRKNNCLEMWSFELGVLFLPSLYCKATFSISLPIHRQPISSNAETLERYSFEVYEGFQTRSPNNGAENQRHLGLTYDPLPVPYSLPPTKYNLSDVPWHVDAVDCTMCTAAGVISKPS